MVWRIDLDGTHQVGVATRAAQGESRGRAPRRGGGASSAAGRSRLPGEYHGARTMGEQSPSRRRSVAVSFASFDGDPYPRVRATGRYLDGPSAEPAGWGPTLRPIGDPQSALFGRLSDWYYLCHPAKGGPERVAGCTAEDVGEDTKRAIVAHVPLEARPRFEIVTWETKAAPNDHGDLWRAVQHELRRIRSAHPGAEIVIVLGTGTDAMHAVLFLAGSVGLVEGPVRLVQVERGEGARLRPHKLIADVTLKLETVLQIAPIPQRASRSR
jgi:hypothetical protein